MYTKVVNVLSNSGTGTQNITFTADPAWTPKVAIVQWSRANTSTDTFQEHASIGFGFTDGTNQRCVATASEDNQARGDSAKIQRNDALICALNPSGTIETVDAVAEFTQWLSNGMQITWSDAPAAQFYIHVLFLGGDDITNATVGTLATGTGTGEISETGLAYQPDMGMFLTAGTNTENSPVVSNFLSVGAATSSSAQWQQSIYSLDNPVTMSTRQYYSHSKVVNVHTATTDGYATFSTFNSTGFILNVTDAFTASYPIYYLVIKGGNFAVGNDTEPANTGDQTITTNKDTKAVFIFGLDLSTENSIQNGCMWTSGVGTTGSGGAQGCDVFEDTTGVADAIVVSRHDTDQIYLNITSDVTATSSTLDDEAALSSVSSTGFVLNWTNIGQARPYRYITFGTGATVNQAPISESSVSVSDSIDPTFYLQKSISETSVSISESLDDTEYYQKSVNEDSVTVGADSIATEADYTKLIDESQLSISDSIEGTKIPAGPTAKIYDVHFVEFPEDITDSVTGTTGAVSSLHTHKYDILEQIEATKTHLYNVVRTVSTTTVHLYNVIGKVLLTRTHKYDVLNSLTASKTHKYDILEQTETTTTHKYNLIEQIEANKTHKYDVEQAQGTVSTTKTHKYHLEGTVTTTKTHLYNILNSITLSTTHKYNVTEQIETTKTHLYNVTGKVTSTKTHLYNVVRTVDTTKVHLYNVLAQITTSKTHKYDVQEAISQVSTTKTHKYDVIGKILTTKTHKYNVLEASSQVTTSTTHKYDVLESITKTVTHKYDIIVSATKTVTHKFDITASIAKTVTHKFNIIEKIITTKTHKHHILNRVTPDTTKTHKYDIIEQIQHTRTHKYNIIGRLYTTKTHKYDQGGKVVVSKRHKYDVGAAFELQELGGSTQAFIKFPERIRIIDIIADLNNRAIANVEIPVARPPANIATAVVAIAEYVSTTKKILTAEVKKPRHRIASLQILAPVIEAIEHRAIAPYIGIEVLEPSEESRIEALSQIQITSIGQNCRIISHTQLTPSDKTKTRIASATMLQQTPITRVASKAQLEMIPFVRPIVAPEIMTRQKMMTLKTLINLLSSDILFQ